MAFNPWVRAGLLRLFVGRINSGEPAPTKFMGLRLLPSEKYLSVCIPICVYQRLGAVSKKTDYMVGAGSPISVPPKRQARKPAPSPPKNG
jgi:hypothetical protein